MSYNTEDMISTRFYTTEARVQGHSCPKIEIQHPDASTHKIRDCCRKKSER